jgi:hypothetical protein
MIRRRRRTVPLVLALASVILATPVAAVGEPEPDPPATALRVALDRALGEHAFLLGEVIRSGIAGAADFNAATSALQQNSDEVVGAITNVYGADAGAAFGEQWRNHVAYIVDYGRALDQNDPDAAQLATEQLDRYVTAFSGFLADALPALPPDAIEGLIGEHVQQLEHVASFDEADFGGAYNAIRETYMHMFAVGDGLTLGIVTLYPDRFTGRDRAFSPATDLRVKLDRLLGEHTYLAALAMRAVLRGATEVQSAAGALSSNSEELSATIADIYGSAAGDAFLGLWSNHVDAYVAYVTAIADGDDAAAAAALDALGAYQADFSRFVADANPFLSSETLEMLISEHTDQLVGQADAYAAGDYEASYQLGREAYAHVGELGASLAQAISDQFPLLIPDTAGSPPRAPVVLQGIVVLVAALILIVDVVGGRRRASRKVRTSGG